MNNVPNKQLAEKKNNITPFYAHYVSQGKQSGAEYVSLVSKFIGFDWRPV